jgi:pimeloyl-ACP methyl ester carboxylesterase
MFWEANRSPLWVLTLAVHFLLASCAVDPLEKPGGYDVYRSEQISIPNPEDPEEPIQARITAPSTDGGQSISAGLFELVVFMPGFGATYPFYDMYAKHLSSHGSIVVGMNFRLPTGPDGRHDYLARQTIYVVDYVVGNGGPLEEHVDPSKIATAGHSLGGKIAFYAAALDPRISLVMALDPSNGGGPPCFISEEWCNAYPVAPNISTGAAGLLDQVHAASFIMRAAPDAFNPDPQSNAEHFFYGLDGQGTHAVSPPALYFDMGSAGHASWLFLGNLNVPRITKRTMVAWLKTHFYGESLEEYFTGEIAQTDIDQGNIVAVGTR